jgi:hypothetical protein
VIPGFVTGRVLGSGAHGKVYLAREAGGLERPVALKVFEDRAEFERELAMTRRIEELRRKGRIAEIVQSLGSGEHDGLSYIVFEYLESGSLADLVARDGPLPLERALGYVRETGRALAVLHREGIFHRDVKPQNLLLGEDGHARLGDFGLSRSLDGTLSAAGSPAFAAPEVIAGRVADGRKADIYSLGATFAFLLTGETVLPGRPDVFSLERKGVPRSLQQAIASACAADPAERPASVEDLVQSLDTKSTERDRTNSGSPDEGAGERPVQVNLVAAPLAEPRLLKRALLSLGCALAVWPTAVGLAIAYPNLRLVPGLAPVLPVLAAICIASPLLLEVLACILGFKSRAVCRANPTRLWGGGFGTAGLIFAVLNLGFPCLLLPFAPLLLLTAKHEAVRESGPAVATREEAPPSSPAAGTDREAGNLPANPFRNAQLHAWATFLVSDVSNGGGVGAGTKTLKSVQRWWVKDLTSEKATIEISSSKWKKSPSDPGEWATIETDLSGRLPLAKLWTDVLGWGVRDFSVSSTVQVPVTQLVGDAKVACDQITVQERDGDGKTRQWDLVCPHEELRLNVGLASLEVREETGERRVLELAGLGTKEPFRPDVTAWGKCFDDLCATSPGDAK